MDLENRLFEEEEEEENHGREEKEVVEEEAEEEAEEEETVEEETVEAPTIGIQGTLDPWGAAAGVRGVDGCVIGILSWEFVVVTSVTPGVVL